MEPPIAYGHVTQNVKSWGMYRDLDQIIKVLGGETVVARTLGCSQSAVSNWKNRGIPPKRQIALVRLADRVKIRPVLTLDEIEAVSEAIAARREDA